MLSSSRVSVLSLMMAVDLHNTDSLLLPSRLLTEVNKHTSQNIWSSSASSSSSSSDFGSALSSPVESELGFTESDTDQNGDYIAELTRQMAHYMLQDDDNQEHQQTWCLGGLSQSKQQEELPRMEKFEDLMINEDIHKYNNSEMFSGTSLKPNSVSSTMMNPSSQIVDFYSKQALIDDQIRAIQFYKLKQQQESMHWRKQVNGHKQMEPQQQQSKQFQNKLKPFSNGQKINLQQQRTINGSQMRAVFLGGAGSRNGGSSGTGVFLPRGIGNTSESRKKSGCSTVLIPARVVQALKLHFDKMGLASRTNGANFPLQHDALVGDVMYGLQLQKKSQLGTVRATNHQHHQEKSLPQEWTY